MTLDAAAVVARFGGVVSHVSAPSSGLAGWHLRVAHVGRGLHPDAVSEPLDAAVLAEDPADAERRAVMKGLERYAAAAWDPATFRWSSAESLGDDAVAIEELAGVQPLDPRDRIRWVEGWDLTDGRPVWLPAVTAHVALPPAVEPEDFWPQSLTGCAVDESLGPAVTRALLEVVERDAVALTALLRRTPVRIAGVEVLAGSTGDAGDLDVALFDITTDVAIPVILAVLGGGAAATAAFGSAAGADPVAAGSQAIAEARCLDALNRVNGGALRALAGRDTPTPSFADRGDTVKLDELAKVDVGKPALMRVLHDAGLHAYAVDLTCDELRDVGAVAVRVVVPGLLPGMTAPGAPLASHPRIARAASAWGLDAFDSSGGTAPR